MNNIEKGKQGERLAERFLKEKGYKIIEKNCRVGRNEIDIIALKKEIIVFVEVKLRNSNAFGKGFEALNNIKKENIVKAAKSYLFAHDFQGYNVRFDVASIDNGKLLYIEDAFNLNY